MQQPPSVHSTVHRVTVWKNPTKDHVRARLYRGPFPQAFEIIDFPPGEEVPLASSYDEQIQTTSGLGNGTVVVGGHCPQLVRVNKPQPQIHPTLLPDSGDPKQLDPVANDRVAALEARMDAIIMESGANGERARAAEEALKSERAEREALAAELAAFKAAAAKAASKPGAKKSDEPTAERTGG